MPAGVGDGLSAPAAGEAERGLRVHGRVVMSSEHVEFYSEQRRRAEESLERLRMQRVGVDRKIKELESFLIIVAEFEGLDGEIDPRVPTDVA